VNGPSASAQNSTASHRIEFGGDVYVLAHKESGNDGIINEYIRAGESLERWSRMIAVRRFVHLDDPGAAVGALARAIKQDNSEAKFAVWINDEKSRFTIDFVTWDENGTVEFNIWIYQKDASGEGLIAKQFAARAYRPDGESFLQNLVSQRPKWLNETMAYEFPALRE
jgi:hypothetical protein